LNQLTSYFKNRFENLVLSEDGTVKIYTDIKEENEAVKFGVGLYNRSESAVLKLMGKDVLEFLQRITTNDVLKLEPFHYVSTLFTNEKGRLIDRTSLIRLEDEFFLIGSKFNDAMLTRWIDKYIITEDVEWENYTNKSLILDIIGPQAESYLTLICGKDVDELDNNKLHKVSIDDTTAYLLKKKASNGELIYWLFSRIENSEVLLNYLLDHKSVFDFAMVGEDSFDRFRVINKVLKGGKEITDQFNPHEAGLINEVSFTKGCYIGQEVISRLDTYEKVQKELRKFEINSNDLNLPYELYSESNELLGIITTLSKNFKQDKIEGLGYFKIKYTSNKVELEIPQSKNDKGKLKIRFLD